MRVIISIIIIILICFLGYIFIGDRVNKLDPVLGKSVIGDACYLYDNVNRNQVILKKMNDIFRLLSKEYPMKLVNGCKKNVYIVGTYTDVLKIEIGEITDLILMKINSKTGFFFKRIDYDNIVEIVDSEGNKNFDYHVFIEDPQEGLMIRLHINVVKFIFPPFEHRKYLTCAQLETPEFPTYEIGYPKEDQFWPLPTEVIVTGKDILSDKGINVQQPAPIRSLYINKLEIYNNNWILKPDRKCNPINPISGVYNVPFDHMPYNGPNTPFQEPNCVANKWIEVPDKPDNIRIWNSVYQPFEWDDKGILSSACKKRDEGYQTSTERMPAQPEYWPTLATIPRLSGPYAWMFGMDRKDIATEGADFSDFT